MTPTDQITAPVKPEDIVEQANLQAAAELAQDIKTEDLSQGAEERPPTKLDEVKGQTSEQPVELLFTTNVHFKNHRHETYQTSVAPKPTNFGGLLFHCISEGKDIPAKTVLVNFSEVLTAETTVKVFQEEKPRIIV